MILRIFLIFGDLSLDDSYKLNSYIKKVCMGRSKYILVRTWDSKGVLWRVSRPDLVFKFGGCRVLSFKSVDLLVQIQNFFACFVTLAESNSWQQK